MMKLAIILCVFVISCDLVRCENNERKDNITVTCQQQEKATDNDIRKWKTNIQPKPKISKCLDACAGEKLGMLTNNKLNVDAAIKMMEMERADEEMISNFKAIMDQCKSITDQDRCELSAKILDCINDGARKRGAMGRRQSNTKYQNVNKLPALN